MLVNTCPKQPTGDNNEKNYTVLGLSNVQILSHIVSQCVKGVHSVETSAFPEIAYTEEFVQGEVERNGYANLWVASRRKLEGANPFGPSAMWGYALTTDQGFKMGGYTVDPENGYVVSVGVLAKAQGQGIGMDLLQNHACFGLFKASRVKKVCLTMRRNNEPMKKVVERVGFKCAQELEGDLYGDGELRDEYVLTYDDWEANLPAEIAADTWYCGKCDTTMDNQDRMIGCAGLKT